MDITKTKAVDAYKEAEATIYNEAENRAFEGGRSLAHLLSLMLETYHPNNKQAVLNGFNRYMNGWGYVVTTDAHLKEMEDGCAVAMRGNMEG